MPSESVLASCRLRSSRSSPARRCSPGGASPVVSSPMSPICDAKLELNGSCPQQVLDKVWGAQPALWCELFGGSEVDTPTGNATRPMMADLLVRTTCCCTKGILQAIAASASATGAWRLPVHRQHCAAFASFSAPSFVRSTSPDSDVSVSKLQAKFRLDAVQRTALAVALQKWGEARDLVSRRRAQIAKELRAAAAANNSDTGHALLLQTVRNAILESASSSSLPIFDK